MKYSYIVISICLILFVSLSTGTIINVPSDYSTIQGGIDASSNGDTVLVDVGTYVENINFNGKNIVVGSLTLTKVDVSYISQTIIDGNESGSVVTFNNKEDSTAVLSGFTIRNGEAENGGGIYLNDSNPNLVNLIITSNSAYTIQWDGLGGGIYLNNSDPNLVNVNITGNYSYDSGGGIYLNNSSPNLMHSTITGNQAYWSGGGIFSYESNPHFENVTVSDNDVDDGSGGGIYLNNSNPHLVNVIINRNSAHGLMSSGSGGGIYCDKSDPSLVDVTISDNSSDSGGGIYMKDSSPSLLNVTISENSVLGTFAVGGGISCGSSNPSLVNVTVSGNTANYDGGGIYCAGNSNPILVNAIFWNDSPQEIYFSEYGDPNSIIIAFSDVEEGLDSIITNDNGTVNWLDGNIDVSPLFEYLANGIIHLQAGSPCIDTGTAFFILEDDTLVDLSEKNYGGSAPDMGAYEYGFIQDSEDDGLVDIPVKYSLYQNYPNPFNPITTILYDLPEQSQVLINIYDILGREIRKLVNTTQNTGFKTVIWDGTDEFGRPVGTGVYLYQIRARQPSLPAPGGPAGGVGQAGDFIQTRKMLLLR